MTSLNKDEEWYEKEVDEMFIVGNMKFAGLANDKCTPQGVKELCHKLAHKIKEDTEKEVVEKLVKELEYIKTLQTTMNAHDISIENRTIDAITLMFRRSISPQSEETLATIKGGLEEGFYNSEGGKPFVLETIGDVQKVVKEIRKNIDKAQSEETNK